MLILDVSGSWVRLCEKTGLSIPTAIPMADRSSQVAGPLCPASCVMMSEDAKFALGF
jgi:hypothetical protein